MMAGGSDLPERMIAVGLEERRVRTDDSPMDPELLVTTRDGQVRVCTLVQQSLQGASFETSHRGRLAR